MEPLHAHSSNWDMAQIIKNLTEVFSGQAHNKQIHETLGLLIQYQLSLVKQPSPEMINYFGEFYRNQFNLYLQVMEPQKESIFSFFEPQIQENDPRYLAWEDTAKLMKGFFNLSGRNPLTDQRRTEILDQIIGQLSTVIRSNGISERDRGKLINVLKLISPKVVQNEFA